MATFSSPEHFKEHKEYIPLLKKALLTVKPKTEKKFFYYQQFSFGAKKLPLVLVDFEPNCTNLLAKEGHKPSAVGVIKLTDQDELNFEATTGSLKRIKIKKYFSTMGGNIKAVYVPAGEVDDDDTAPTKTVVQPSEQVSTQTTMSPQMEKKLQFEENEFQKRQIRTRVGELQAKTFPPTLAPELKTQVLKTALELAEKGQFTQANKLLDGLAAKLVIAPVTQAQAPVTKPKTTAKPAQQPTPPTKRTKSEQDFDRRKAKTEAALAKLPAGDPQLAEFKTRIDAVNKLATEGNARRAYRDLKQLKIEARRAGTKFAASLNARDLARDAASLLVEVESFAQLVTNLNNGTEALLKDIGKQPKGSACKTEDEAFEFRKYFVNFEQWVRSQLEGARGQRDRALDFANTAEVAKKLEEFAHKIGVLQAQKNPPTKDLAAASETLSKIGNTFKLAGKPITSDVLTERFRKHDQDVEAKLAEWRDISKFQKRDQEKLPGNRFGALQAMEEKRLLAAKEQFKKATAYDVVLGDTKDKSRKVEPLRRFEAVDFIDELEDDLPLPEKIDSGRKNAICAKAEQKIQELIDSEKATSDVVFDLTLKTKEEMVQELADSLGLDVGSCTSDQQQLIQEMAARMMEKIKKATPNTLSAKKVKIKGKTGEIETAEEIKLNGKTYKNPSFLGKGGVGTIFRYEDAEKPGTFVVVKSLNDPERREEMVHELKVHRHAMGGEDGQGHKNIVGMRGAVRGEDDSLHMVLDYEGGGDLRRVSNSVQAAAASGVVSEAARTAINQYFFKQAVEGMKYVQDQNMTHHDIKDMNYLVSEDGTVKVADFGSAQVSKEESGKVKGRGFESTAKYEAPEIGGQAMVTGKADTYTLGTMLDTMAGNVGGFDKGFKGEFEQSKQAVTALDRLKSAMLDPDPDKRPTLEAVQFSAYLADAGQNYPEAQMKELIKATMDYSKKVGGEILDIQTDINVTQVDIQKLEQSKKGKPRDEVAAVDKKIAPLKSKIADAEKRIEAINNRDEIKPLVAQLKKLGAGFK
jgi:serine/threonine protein kinase